MVYLHHASDIIDPSTYYTVPRCTRETDEVIMTYSVSSSATLLFRIHGRPVAQIR